MDAMFGLSHVIIVSTDQYPETTIRICFNYLEMIEVTSWHPLIKYNVQ